MSGFKTNAPTVPSDLDYYFITEEDLITRYGSGNYFTWGFGLNGALGSLSTITRSSPVLYPAVAGLLGPPKKIVACSTGSTNNVSGAFLMLTGGNSSFTSQLATWGNNSYGQLGINTLTHRSSPVIISTDNWVDIMGGNYFFLALKGDGTINSWGYNVYGQLGDGTTIYRSSPVLVLGSDVLSSFNAGNDYYKKLPNRSTEYVSGAIKTDGTLWVWGGLRYIGMGNNNTAYRSSPVQFGTANTWDKITFSNDNFAAVKKDGTLWTCGYSASIGMLGDGTTISRSSPVQLGTSTDWENVFTSYQGFFALKQNGTLWAWGSNGHGHLGVNTTIHYSSPVQVGTGTDWKKVDNSFDSNTFPGNNTVTLGLKTDGSLWWWGGDVIGLGGTGGTVYRSSPIQLSPQNRFKDIARGAFIAAAIGLTN